MLQHNWDTFFTDFRAFIWMAIVAFILSKKISLVILRIGTFDELLQVRQRGKENNFC